ncbi:hypothetical protein BLTE_15890 [Blastochloris tepida]|uniref:Major capsid protein n=2 Tax=Blastochloris tepida TaxID=2233851 RepID=A0A348G021_9HYPH|nr:hypothetical protein BLTE_15890 [Blastochloris tepida]
MTGPSLPLNVALGVVTLDVSATAAPDWVKVTPRGSVMTRDGRSYRFDPEMLAARYVAEGVDIPVDLDHAISRKTVFGERADAVGWVKELQPRLDGLYARVEWLKAGLDALAARTHRFISPTFHHDASGAATWLHSVALVAAPALAMPAIAAALGGPAASSAPIHAHSPSDQQHRAALAGLGLNSASAHEDRKMSEPTFPYSDVDLTTQVNRIPNEFGLLRALNLFPSEDARSRFVEIRIEDGVLVVLAAEEPGAPGNQVEWGTGSSIVIKIPHIPHGPESIRPDDLQGILDAAGRIREPKSFDKELAKRLGIIRSLHGQTLEYLRLGALKGVIRDGKGRTLYDLYSVFGITKKTVDFELGTAGTSVLDKCEEVVDHILCNLKGETSTGVEAIVSSSFFGKLIQHPKVEKYWLATQQAFTLGMLERSRLGGNWGRVFEFSNIMFREYKGSALVRNGAGQIISEPNVADGMGHAYPVGTRYTAYTLWGPAHHVDFVNQAAPEVVVSQEPIKHGGGWELKSQSNVLPIWKRPEALVELTTSN